MGAQEGTATSSVKVIQSHMLFVTIGYLVVVYRFPFIPPIFVKIDFPCWKKFKFRAALLKIVVTLIYIKEGNYGNEIFNGKASVTTSAFYMHYKQHIHRSVCKRIAGSFSLVWLIVAYVYTAYTTYKCSIQADSKICF